MRRDVYIRANVSDVQVSDISRVHLCDSFLFYKQYIPQTNS